MEYAVLLRSIPGARAASSREAAVLGYQILCLLGHLVRYEFVHELAKEEQVHREGNSDRCHTEGATQHQHNVKAVSKPKLQSVERDYRSEQ